MSEETNAYAGDGGKSDGDTCQFVTFFLSDQEFGVDIQSVKEIKGWQQTTALPNTPPYVIGALNLRGQIIAVYDLRYLLGIGKTDIGPGHVVVVVELGERCLGLLADSVSDILTLDASEIRPVPSTSISQDQYLVGLIARGEKMVSILDLPTVAGEELGNEDDDFFDADEEAA